MNDAHIPMGVRPTFRYHTPLSSRIAQEVQEIEFYRGMLLRSVRAGKIWRTRGDTSMADANRTNAQAYLDAWRHRRRCLNELRNLEKGVRQ